MESTPDDARWMPKFEKLREHKTRNGNFNFSNAHDNALRSWAWKQKRLMEEKKLPKKRRNQLSSIGFPSGESIATPSQKTLMDATSLNQNRTVTAQSHRSSLIDRTRALEASVGLTVNRTDKLFNKVALLETELFGKTKKGTIADRISALEKEMQ